MELLRGAIRGALAGIPATFAMSIPMLAAKRFGLISKQAPEQLMSETLARAGIHDPTGGRATDALAAASHVGFGVGAGAIYGALETRRPRRMPAAVAGMAFGALVWAVSYMGWIPALGLMPAPDEDEPARPILMFGAHILFGAVLGKLVERPRKARRRGRGRGRGKGRRARKGG